MPLPRRRCIPLAATGLPGALRHVTSDFESVLGGFYPPIPVVQHSAIVWALHVSTPRHHEVHFGSGGAQSRSHLGLRRRQPLAARRFPPHPHGLRRRRPCVPPGIPAGRCPAVECVDLSRRSAHRCLYRCAMGASCGGRCVDGGLWLRCLGVGCATSLIQPGFQLGMTETE